MKCRNCGSVFATKNPSRKFCSPKCKWTYHNRNSRPRVGSREYGIQLGKQIDPFACRTWDQVAAKFNEQNGTHLTRARIMQIGQAAMAKLIEQANELTPFVG